MRITFFHYRFLIYVDKLQYFIKSKRSDPSFCTLRSAFCIHLDKPQFVEHFAIYLPDGKCDIISILEIAIYPHFIRVRYEINPSHAAAYFTLHCNISHRQIFHKSERIYFTAVCITNRLRHIRIFVVGIVLGHNEGLDKIDCIINAPLTDSTLPLA